MARTFYIYHLPGKKVGCTSNPQKRFETYRAQGYTGQIVILQKMNCSVQQAGDIEWRYADHFGYRRGWHYSTTFGAKPFKAKLFSGVDRVNPNKIKVIPGRKTKR
jgi:hypothetical protein